MNEPTTLPASESSLHRLAEIRDAILSGPHRGAYHEASSAEARGWCWMENAAHGWDRLAQLLWGAGELEQSLWARRREAFCLREVIRFNALPSATRRKYLRDAAADASSNVD